MIFRNNNARSEYIPIWNTPLGSSLSPNILLNKEESKLILFMVGGSAASIYRPLLRFFLKEVPNNYIVPVFIDRKFHSSFTSNAIEDIANYEEFCRLSLIKSSSTEPLLFVEDTTESIFENEVLRRIIGSVKEDDNVFICTSIHSEYNTNLILQLDQTLLSRISAKRISYGFFLPYLQFSTNDRLSTLIHPDKEKTEQMVLNSNLEKLVTRFTKIRLNL